MRKSGWVSRVNVQPPNSYIQGQYIKSVFESSPAARAGMLCGDHVLEVDGTDVTEMTHMKVL